MIGNCENDLELRKTFLLISILFFYFWKVLIIEEKCAEQWLCIKTFDVAGLGPLVQRHYLCTIDMIYHCLYDFDFFFPE